jgi:hypothetical protein
MQPELREGRGLSLKIGTLRSIDGKVWLVWSR